MFTECLRSLLQQAPPTLLKKWQNNTLRVVPKGEMTEMTL